MNTFAKTSSLLLAVLLRPPVAQAIDANPNGLELLERCRKVEARASEPSLDAEQRRSYGYCLGYMVGFVSGFAARDVSGAAGRFCPPVDARIADYAQAINAYLVAHPDQLEAMGALVALRAFQWKFPCPDEVRQDGAQ